MIAYLSYSSLGYAGAPDEFLVAMHKIAAYCLKKNFGEVHLITDSVSKPHFSSIPWTSVTTELDQVPPDYPQVWSLSKLYAFREIAKRGHPFIHTDNDVFLWKGIPDRLRNAQVFGQQPENVFDYRYEPQKMFSNCPSKHIFEVSCPPTAINVGIFGGNNVKFIGDYADSAIAFVEDSKNEWFWKEYSGYWSWWCKATLAEQWFLGAFAMHHRVKVETLFSQWPSKEEAKEACYTHLMARKKHPDVREAVLKLAQRLVRMRNDLVDLGFGHGQLDEALAA